ncbi:hypothetical protein ADL15_30020 [Actinoplanes awajinensis subsp. mycoplanecinus]|uniref:Uncharacterized protein n=1 Tax=Actinoplanes awajinensis subsp. mycoplanecinus TaxID=135947 RepID=A0A101JL57_9ACTN|nr:hypothetical protein ADL15_30020 [Actinoplanes awajinensis subsp. mycoplanecinus]
MRRTPAARGNSRCPAKAGVRRECRLDLHGRGDRDVTGQELVQQADRDRDSPPGGSHEIEQLTDSSQGRRRADD